MDIDGQHDKATAEDPHGVFSTAAGVLTEHTQDSATGCCGKCGRPWASELMCGAPEVMRALEILRHRPETRRSGANRLTLAYPFR